MKTLPTLEATCRPCGGTFNHPSLGDFPYGEAVLCSVDGKSYATADAFCAAARHVRSTLATDDGRAFWTALATLADPIDGQALTATIRCPHCGSDDLASWGGRMTGTREVPEARFDSDLPTPAADRARR